VKRLLLSVCASTILFGIFAIFNYLLLQFPLITILATAFIFSTGLFYTIFEDTDRIVLRNIFNRHKR